MLRCVALQAGLLGVATGAAAAVETHAETDEEEPSHHRHGDDQGLEVHCTNNKTDRHTSQTAHYSHFNAFQSFITTRQKNPHQKNAAQI